MEVNNQKEELCGHLAIAGYPKALRGWLGYSDCSVTSRGVSEWGGGNGRGGGGPGVPWLVSFVLKVFIFQICVFMRATPKQVGFQDMTYQVPKVKNAARPT